MTVEEKRKQLMLNYCGKVGSCTDCEIQGKCTSVSAMYTVSNMKDENVEELYAMDLKAHERKRTEVAEFCDEHYRCEGCPIKKQCDDYTNANPSEMAREKFDYFYKNIFKSRNKVHDSEQSFDPVKRPQHYASTSIECIDAIIETQGEEAVIDFCVCNAFKYLWRHNSKNGDEDVRKANWYLNKAVELMDKYEKPNEF